MWKPEWLRHWMQDSMCNCTRGFEPHSWQTFVFYLTSNTSNKRVSAWMAEWLRHWIQDPMCNCTRGFEPHSWQTFVFYLTSNTSNKRVSAWMAEALDSRSDVHLHAWVRIPLLAITFFYLMIWKHALFIPKFAQ